LIYVKRNIGAGISLPKQIIARIDTDRGDVSRSKYILRILEKMRHKSICRNHCNLEEKGSQESLDHDGVETVVVKHSSST
jgi:hypothetical protein